MIICTDKISKKYDHSAIFDMDGLLIDSEPLWYEAANEVFMNYGFQLSPEAYSGSIGLRTKEFVHYWFMEKKIPLSECIFAEQTINVLVINKIAEKGIAMPGVYSVLEKLKSSNITIGLATSSPTQLIDVVVDKLKIRDYFSAFASAEALAHGKPHPQVYLNCAEALGAKPVNCICFEDSFNGMIAAKAARMTCIVVPPKEFIQQPRFRAADLILNSLDDFSLEDIEALRH